MVGQAVSHYRIIGEIGSGGMGVVYKAEDTRIGAPVALKFLPEELTADESSKRRFIREAQAAFALDHPNICNIHEIDETADGRLFICMSYYEGESLRDRIAREPVDPLEAIRIACSVAAGLAKAHAEGIVHRDIKPANVFVTQEGEVKILDFGLAKLTGRSRVTKTGASPGTIAYMSPEQVTGSDVDARSDIFALGAVLYELLTGHAPFEADREAAVMYRILNEAPEPISKTCGECPRGLQLVLDKALQKAPGDRYQTVTEFKDDLDRILQGLVPTVRRWRRWPSRPVIALSALLLAVTAVVVTPSLRRTASRWLPLPVGHEVIHVAVLPFENIAGDPANQAFCDGMMETLTSKLTQLEQFHGSLWVVPASDVRRNGAASASEAVAAFGVNLVVTGSVQATRDGLRLTMNLVSVESEVPRQLASSVMDILMTDIAALQDRIVLQMADMLDIRMTPGVRTALAAGNTGDSQAFDAYLRGRGYLERHEKGNNLDLAIESFNLAIERDDSYALAYAKLGEAYWLKYNVTKDTNWITRAKDSCTRAAALSPDLADVHVSQGIVDRGTGHYEDAVTHFQRAVDLEPGNTNGYRGLASAYADLGRAGDAEATYRKAIETKPDFWAAHNDLGMFLLRQGRYADAAVEFREVAALTPDNVWAHSNLGAAFYYQEKWDEAADAFKRALEIKPFRPAYNNLATIAYIKGNYDEAVRTYLEALAMDNTDYTTWANLGNSYYWSTGERPKAMDAYRHALELAEEKRKVNPRDVKTLVKMASYYAILGEPAAARSRLEEAIAIAPDDLTIIYYASHTYEQLGDRDKAMDWMAKALDKGYPVGEVEQDPFMQSLKTDERFIRLAAEHRK